MGGSNLNSAFGDVVSVEAWRGEFDSQGRAKVHVDLSFLVGELGSEDECEVTFTVSLKRAVLRIVVPPNEPIGVIQSSVDREPTLEGLKKVIRESTSGLSTGAGISAKMRGSGVGIDATGAVSAGKRRLETTKVETEARVSEFSIRQFKDSTGCYAWEIAAEQGGGMKGKVWDPVSQPRLKIKQTSPSKIEPVLQAHVLCRRQDIIIDKVRPKASNALANRFLKNRMAAAKAVVREKIISLGLSYQDGNNDLVEIQIADTLIVSELT